MIQYGYASNKNSTTNKTDIRKTVGTGYVTNGFRVYFYTSYNNNKFIDYGGLINTSYIRNSICILVQTLGHYCANLADGYGANSLFPTIVVTYTNSSFDFTCGKNDSSNNFSETFPRVSEDEKGFAWLSIGEI